MSANSIKQVFFFFIIISSEETSREENTEKVLAEAKPAQSPGFNVSSSCFCKPHTHTHTHTHTQDVRLRTKHSTFTICANQPPFTSGGGVINRAAEPADISNLSTFPSDPGEQNTFQVEPWCFHLSHSEASERPPDSWCCCSLVSFLSHRVSSRVTPDHTVSSSNTESFTRV